MTTYIIAGIATFGFTTVLTIAGVGAAFILIPVFIALGVGIHEAMATALLLNSIAMVFASRTFIMRRLVVFKTAIPILIAAAILSPLGAYTSKFLSRDILLWMFSGFLLFAGSMMLFYRAKQKEMDSGSGQLIGYGVGVGSFAGYLGGLLGVGGGNFIVPVLVWLGFDPKKASATTAFIVIFSSLAGFFGHASLGHMNINLLWVTAMGSIAGAVLGAWLMGEKMKSRQVKVVIGVILYLIAAKMIWNLLT